MEDKNFLIISVLMIRGYLIIKMQNLNVKLSKFLVVNGLNYKQLEKLLHRDMHIVQLFIIKE